MLADVQPASWTVLIYMRSTAGLSDMALKNINALLAANFAPPVNVFVQIQAYGEVALRFSVEPGILRQAETIELTGDDKQDLVDALQWAQSAAARSAEPAKKHMVILWGSGFGILNPVWNDDKEHWWPEPDADDMPLATCSLSIGTEKRAILLSEEPRKYVANNDFAAIVKSMSELLGKPIDILGLDMCLGGMLEIGYQVAPDAQHPYARYLIASQNCELKDGWNYAAFGDALRKAQDTEELACLMADSFEEYYQPRAAQGNYTQTVVDLSYMQEIKDTINRLTEIIMACKEHYGEPFKTALMDARKKSVRFCFMPMYTDVVTLCHKIREELRTLPASPLLVKVSDELEKLCTLIVSAVKANKTGYQMKGLANGLSIYFPFVRIDTSYDNSFTHDSRWLEFLQYVLS
jgi:Clostripain family